MKKKMNLSFNKLFNIAFYLFLAMAALSILTLAATAIVLVLNIGGRLLLAILMVVLALFVAGLFADIIFLLVFNKKIYQERLYVTVKKNLDKIVDHKKNLDYHVEPKKAEFLEFKELNYLLDEVVKICEQTVVYNNPTDYEELGIQFVGESKFVCTYISLIRNVNKIILSNESYRSALIDFYYDLVGDEDISPADEQRIIETIKNDLKYDNILISEHLQPNKGFLVFIPKFESIRQIEEEISFVLKKLSIVKPNTTSVDMVMCRAGLVAYPFSSIDSIISDLHYAVKQDKIINTYLPQYQAGKNDSLVQSTMNLANIARFLCKFASLSYDNKDVSGNFRKVNQILKQVADYYEFESSGLIYFNDTKERYNCFYEYSVDGASIFKKGDDIDTDLINAIDKVKDDDMSYYFSSNAHINSELAPYLGFYQISSGQFYVIRDTNKVFGVVYFLNREKDINLDAYMREGLLTFSYFISAYSREIITRKNAAMTDDRFEEIVRITNTRLYSVDKESKALVYASDALVDVIPNFELRKPCYKVLYGLEEPCKDCPLATKNRKLSTIGGEKYETTVAIRSDETASLLVEPHVVKGANATRDRFDPYLLLNSYTSFIERVNNFFIDNSDGYVLFMQLDDVKKIISECGNEGYTEIIRNFADRIREKHHNLRDIYLFKDDVLAVTIPLANRHIIINLVESIFLLSRDLQIGEETRNLSITYYAMKYLLDYSGVTEFVKEAEKQMVRLHSDTTTDYLHFVDSGYSRQASKEAFYLDVIDSAFGKDTYGVRIQPAVNLKQRIVSAEAFVRLTDNYRNIILPTGDLIQTAAKYGKVDVITNALINTIGRIYSDNGYQTFKTLGLTCISINTNFEYLRSEGLLETLGSLGKTYSMPKDVLALEFTEEDIAEHRDDFKALVYMLRDCDVSVICDHYTGKLVSIEDLRSFGVSQVKFAFNLLKGIAIYKVDLERVQQLSRQASDCGITPVLVGIEDALQYSLVQETCGEFLTQGHFFYDPLEQKDFIAAIKKANSK